MIRRIVKITVVLLFLGTVFGFDVPNYDGYVTDQVGIFSEEQKTSLISKIEEIEKTTGIEIAILVVPTVDDDINLAAVEVGNVRGVGKRGQNNGMVVLIAIDDRKRSIQVGYGLEGTIPDIIADKMGEENFPSHFRNGDYYAGIMAMIDDFLGYITQDPIIINTYTQNFSKNTLNDDMMSILFFTIIIIIITFGYWVTIPKVKGTGRKMRKYGRWIYGVVGFVLAFLIMIVMVNFIVSLFVSYIFLLFSILIALFGKGGRGGYGGIRFGSGGSSRGGGSSFGGFGGGSFGGGGSSGSR